MVRRIRTETLTEAVPETEGPRPHLVRQNVGGGVAQLRVGLVGAVAKPIPAADVVEHIWEEARIYWRSDR